jgi:hypothetical protein
MPWWQREVAQSGICPETAILGNVVQNRAYPPMANLGFSGEVVQTGLLIPGGVGGLFWDSEEFADRYRTGESLESDAWLRFTPYDELGPALQGLIAIQIDDLVIRFVRLLDDLLASAPAI